MKRITAVVALTVVVALVASDADAAKRRKKYRSAPVAATHVEKTDNAMLCDGGMMIPADDQIRGCTALVATRLSNERRATAYYNRGNAYVGKSDFARAIADYTDAIKYKNDYAAALFNRAVAQRISGNPQLAIADYTTVIALTPADADAFAGRGVAYAKLAQFDKALADFNQALKLKPDHVTALTQRGHYAVRAQQWAAALSDYAAVLGVQKTNAEAYYGRGVVKVYSGDVKGGQLDLAQAAVFDSGIAARMTAQGIPPPQIFEAAPEIKRAPEKPAATTAATDESKPATTP